MTTPLARDIIRLRAQILALRCRLLWQRVKIFLYG
jgi:hypothetical protein